MDATFPEEDVDPIFTVEAAVETSPVDAIEACSVVVATIPVVDSVVPVEVVEAVEAEDASEEVAAEVPDEVATTPVKAAAEEPTSVLSPIIFPAEEVLVVAPVDSSPFAVVANVVDSDEVTAVVALDPCSPFVVEIDNSPEAADVVTAAVDISNQEKNGMSKQNRNMVKKLRGMGLCSVHTKSMFEMWR